MGARTGSAVLARAQHGAEQLLAAAGLGQEAIAQVAGAIMRAAEQAPRRLRAATMPSSAPAPPAPAAAFAGSPPVASPPPCAHATCTRSVAPRRPRRHEAAQSEPAEPQAEEQQPAGPADPGEQQPPQE